MLIAKPSWPPMVAVCCLMVCSVRSILCAHQTRLDLASREDAMDAIVPSSISPEQIMLVVRWLFGGALQLANIIQAPALILTAGVAWLLCRPVQNAIVNRIRKLPERQRLDWVVQHQAWLTQRLVPLLTPTAWAVGLWVSVFIAKRTGWPDAVARVTMNLLLAWLVIRLAADIVPNAVLARLIAVLA